MPNMFACREISPRPFPTASVTMKRRPSPWAPLRCMAFAALSQRWARPSSSSGLALLGQLTARILKASGIQTIGADLNAERIEQARKHGLDLAITSDGDEPEQQVARLTDGVGADAVIVTAASASPELLNAALRMCRRKGRVVLVGDVPINIDRADIYAKEIDFRISTSYGPGRYDRNYEEGGLDYPVGYVRWTENRNMQAYLGLLASGAVKVRRSGRDRYPIDRAATAYAVSRSSERKAAQRPF